MHPYYASKLPKLRKDMQKYLNPIANELADLTKRPYSELFEEIFTCYKEEMVAYFPYIGGDQNSGTNNLTGAYCFVAMGEVLKKYDVNLETWGYLTTKAYRCFFNRFPHCLLILAGKLMAKPKLITKLLKKKDLKNAENAKLNPGSFVTQTQVGNEIYPVRYDTQFCPLAAFASEHGYQEYMPYICNLDYVMFEAMQVPFYREQTLASGDSCCDFKLKAHAKVNPAWPCHAANPDDPLK